MGIEEQLAENFKNGTIDDAVNGGEIINDK